MVISPSPSQNIERVGDNDRKYVKKSAATSGGMVPDSKKQQKDKNIVNNWNRFLRENLKILSDRKGPKRGPIPLRGVGDGRGRSTIYSGLLRIAQDSSNFEYRKLSYTDPEQYPEDVTVP